MITMGKVSLEERVGKKTMLNISWISINGIHNMWMMGPDKRENFKQDKLGNPIAYCKNKIWRNVKCRSTVEESVKISHWCMCIRS